MNTMLVCCAGSCGSCYSFASMAMLESRVRILTNNTLQPVFSPQDIVECSNYSQGSKPHMLRRDSSPHTIFNLTLQAARAGSRTWWRASTRRTSELWRRVATRTKARMVRVRRRQTADDTTVLITNMLEVSMEGNYKTKQQKSLSLEV